MPETLKEFKTRALARPEVQKTYDQLGDEFGFLEETLKARAAAGLTHMPENTPIRRGRRATK